MNLTRIAKHARGALAAVADAFLKFLRNQDEGARRWDGVWHGPPPPQHINCRCAVWPIVGDPKPRPSHYQAPPPRPRSPPMFRFPYAAWARAMTNAARVEQSGGTSAEIAFARLMAITTSDRIRLRDARVLWYDQPKPPRSFAFGGGSLFRRIEGGFERIGSIGAGSFHMGGVVGPDELRDLKVDLGPSPLGRWPAPPPPRDKLGAVTISIRINTDAFRRLATAAGALAREIHEWTRTHRRLDALRTQAKRKGKPGWRHIHIPRKPAPRTLHDDSPDCAGHTRPFAPRTEEAFAHAQGHHPSGATAPRKR